MKAHIPPPARGYGYWIELARRMKHDRGEEVENPTQANSLYRAIRRLKFKAQVQKQKTGRYIVWKR